MFLDVKIQNLDRDFDGRNWARTSDLQRVELALFQLSYAPGTGSLPTPPTEPSAGTPKSGLFSPLQGTQIQVTFGFQLEAVSMRLITSTTHTRGLEPSG